MYDINKFIFAALLGPPKKCSNNCVEVHALFSEREQSQCNRGKGGDWRQYLFMILCMYIYIYIFIIRSSSKVIMAYKPLQACLLNHISHIHFPLETGHSHHQKGMFVCRSSILGSVFGDN